MVRFVPATFLLLWLVAGCAQGGPTGGTDAGPRDSSVIVMDAARVDSGTMGTDSGTMGTDSGMMGTDSGMMGTDGGVDGGFDSGFDSGPPPDCVTAADCNDGLSCNGTESCDFGSCAAGTPLTCDDGVACTRNDCVEGTPPTCNYVPQDSSCPAGQTCDRTSGCLAACSESPCRVVSPQCGCPSGQGCYVSGGARVCTGAGTRPTGATCTGLATCTPGNICINVAQSGAAANMCNRFCNLDSECAGGICLYTLNDGSGGTVPGVTICTSPCNPILQTGCPTGTACTIFRETGGAMRYFSDCSAPFGSGSQGAICTDQSDCRAGYGCFGTAPGNCLAWCDRPGTIGTAGGCRSGEACYGFMTPIRVGATEYGVCDTFP